MWRNEARKVALSPKENSIKVLKHLLKETELSNSLVIAMMANIAVETGYTYDYKTKQKGLRTDPAFGLFQFDPVEAWRLYTMSTLSTVSVTILPKRN